MFKKLRLRLTLVNIAVVGVILLLFLSGIYIFMSRELDRQSTQLLINAAMEIRKDDKPLRNDKIGNWSNTFYVRADSTGKITGTSASLPVTYEELKLLYNKAVATGTENGIISSDSGSFRFFENPPRFQDDTIYLFLSTEFDDSILARLRAVLISVGFGSIILVFFSSIFLANKALIPINKAWERQQNFTADASHELRSPLTVIQTNLEVVMDNRYETVETQMKWLENIHTENKRMSKLVSDLLFLARADSNQQLIEKKFFPISDALREVMDIYCHVAQKKDIKFTSDIASNLEYFGDESRIKQLVVILIDNALKYTNPSGNVNLVLASSDSHLEIVVTDDGEGIEEEHLKKIFERFYRVDKARSRDGGGTGLGLAIADWIVKEHRGSINVSSVKNSGTTFRISLPRLLPKK
ncbi:MAG: sensor histidine kinase [Clostridiales bacterium]|nr:sensor histidine kinase [Clostridiales bacterium]